MTQRMTTPTHAGSAHPARRGAILIIALVVTLSMTGIVLVMCEQMRVEAMSAANRAASAQAEEIEQGAEQYAIGLLSDPTISSDPTQSVFDLAEDQFAAIQVGNGYFWIVRPDYDDTTLPMFGFTDESGKININTAGDTMLTNLLNGDSDTASAIESWRSPTASDDDSYYSMQQDAYQSKHAPYESVEELLMVRNITRQMLYGDGTAPPIGERANVMAQPSANIVLTDSQIARGIFDLLTVYSKEPTTAPDGSDLIALNTAASKGQPARVNRSALTKLFQQLNIGNASSIMGKVGTRTQLADLFDLYNRAAGSMTTADLDTISDYIAAPTGAMKGRIDINTAPAAVLYTLVGVGSITSADIDKLIAQRQTTQPEQGQIGWVADALKGDAVGLGRYVTGRTYQYSADIVAVSGNGRAFKHCRVVIDASAVPAGGAPQIVYRRDLTDRGWPMDPALLTSLRSGQGLGSWSVGSGSGLPGAGMSGSGGLPG